MFCTNCGAQIADDSQFCTKCGTSFQQQSAVEDLFQAASASPTMVAPAISSTYAPQAAQPVQQKSPKGRGVLIVLVAIALLALIGAIILVVVNPFGVGDSKTSTAGQTASNAPSSEQASSTSESTDKANNKEDSKDSATELSPQTTSSTDTVLDSTPGSASASNSELDSGLVSTSTSPFYGIWIGAFTVKEEAESYCAEARSKGFDAKIFESNQWSNLNQDHYWVITAETAQTQESADRQLTAVKSAGYSNAYVKYSGTYKG